MTFRSSSGISNPVTNDIILSDDIQLSFGTDSDQILGFNTNQSTPNLYLGLSEGNPLILGSKDNWSNDQLGVDVSSLLPNPAIIFTSKNDSQNEFAIATMLGDERTFSIFGIAGDYLDGTQTTDNGVGLRWSSGDGGTSSTGGNGGAIEVSTGSGGGTAGNGGSLSLNTAAGSGTGTPGTIDVTQGGVQKYRVGTDGSQTITAAGNVSTAVRIGESGRIYITVDSTTGAQTLIFGDASEAIDFLFRSSKTLTVNSGFAAKVTTSGAGNYSLQEGNLVLLKTGITGGGDTVTLPSGVNTGQTFIIKDASGSANTNNITIDTAGAETIDGASTYTMNVNYQSVTVVFDGTNYFIM